MTAPIAPELSATSLAARYAVERLLGRGGMGSVYLARDRQLDRPVAIKVLSADVAHDEALRERFARETRVAASFSHPNIVPVFGVEEGEGILACAMGYVEGESVAERVARSGPLGSRELIRLLLDVAYALAYAHGREVVHRDLKPDNVMLERATGRALLMDFGIARRMNAAPAAGLTRVGEVVGTPTYMSPEQIAGESVDGRSDLYSLGLLAAFAATGTHLMDASTTTQVLARQLTEVPPPLATLRPDLPSALCDVVDACLAKEVNDRPIDAKTLVEALERAQEAAPEVPLPLRLFVQELGTSSLVVTFIALLMISFIDSAAEKLAKGDLNPVVLAVIAAALIATRLLQVAGELRGFARAGWTLDDLRGGLDVLTAERATLRLQQASDERALRSRARTVRTARTMFAIGVMSLVLTMLPQLLHRSSFADAFAAMWTEARWLPYVQLALVFNGCACLAVSLLLWVRNPLRESPQERLFRWFWLGLPGRTLFRLAWPRGARDSAKQTTTVAGFSSPGFAPPRPRTAVSASISSTVPTPALPASQVAHVAGDVAMLERLTNVLDAVERRLAAIEAREREK